MTEQLYHILLEQIKQILPNERITRVRGLAWIMTGLFLSKTSQSKILSKKIIGTASNDSKAKRVSRWLQNSAVHVRRWYAPIAINLLQTAHQSGQIRLLVDGTKIGGKHQLLMVALAYRKRALPIAWTWSKGTKGHSSGKKQIALLHYIHSLLPENAVVYLAGDSEFGSVSVLKQLDSWGWMYALRQKGRYLVTLEGKEESQRIDSLADKPGQKSWYQNVLLTDAHLYKTNLLVFWNKGEKEPWLLATNFLTSQDCLRVYKRRMWIEEMFGDFKSNGFDLETTRLQHFQRLSRLTMAVSMLYVWVIAFGITTIKNGNRHPVDSRKKRQLSVFRIGYDMMERLLEQFVSFKIRKTPYMNRPKSKVSVS